MLQKNTGIFSRLQLVHVLALTVSKITSSNRGKRFYESHLFSASFLVESLLNRLASVQELGLLSQRQLFTGQARNFVRMQGGLRVPERHDDAMNALMNLLLFRVSFFQRNALSLA